eukprot:8479588-Pyramimonas_sp.AAC.1
MAMGSTASDPIDDDKFESDAKVRELSTWAQLEKGDLAWVPYGCYAFFTTLKENAQVLQLPYVSKDLAGSVRGVGLGPFINHLRKNSSEKPWSKIGPLFSSWATECVGEETVDNIAKQAKPVPGAAEATAEPQAKPDAGEAAAAA